MDEQQQHQEWKDFFNRYGDYDFSIYFYENEAGVSLEDVYQMFKERMKAEEAGDGE